jgi:hypothetical protein
MSQPMWRCPHCGREFAQPNQRHSCAVYTLEPHFEGKSAAVRQTYDQLLAAAGRLGPMRTDPRHASIHLVNRVTFGGIHTRKNYLYLELVIDRSATSSRLQKSEQVSANRYHLTFRLDSADDVDEEMVALLEEAYRLAG